MMTRFVQVLSTIHDAVVLSVPEAELSLQQPRIVDILERAAAVVIGAPIRVDVKVIVPGERLLTEETARTWHQVMRALDEGTKSVVAA
jgi:hypothetical protein